MLGRNSYILGQISYIFSQNSYILTFFGILTFFVRILPEVRFFLFAEPNFLHFYVRILTYKCKNYPLKKPGRYPPAAGLEKPLPRIVGISIVDCRLSIPSVVQVSGSRLSIVDC